MTSCTSGSPDRYLRKGFGLALEASGAAGCVVRSDGDGWMGPERVVSRERLNRMNLTCRNEARIEALLGVTLNRPGFLGDSIPWKGRWSHANREDPGEAVHAALHTR